MMKHGWTMIGKVTPACAGATTERLEAGGPAALTVIDKLRGKKRVKKRVFFDHFWRVFWVVFAWFSNDLPSKYLEKIQNFFYQKPLDSL
jgi:hypothetical protein